MCIGLNGRRSKSLRAGVSKETCAGTYSNEHRPLTSALAQRFLGSYICHFAMNIHRY